MHRWLLPSVCAGFALALLVLASPAGAQLAGILSASDIAVARGTPIAQGGKEIVTGTVGTTPVSMFTDLSSTNRVATYVQNIRVSNRHATQRLCVFDLAWSGATTCNVLCGAATATCSGASTDGAPIAAGGSYAESWAGTACLCVVGSAAATSLTAERVARGPF